MESKQSTFKLQLPNDTIIDLPPKKTTTNLNVYNYVKQITKDDLILYYQGIPLPKEKKINLIDIGYDPYKYLLMKPYEIKECVFIISKYNYKFIEKFNSYQKIFEIKDYFANKFHTIAQNIVVKDPKNKSKHFTDEEILTNNESLLFEIDVIEGFSLYYVFYDTFYFICLSDKSTFSDLRATLASYHDNLYTEIHASPELLKVIGNSQIDNSKIIDYASKIPIIDFKYQPHDKSKDPNLNITLETENDPKNFVYDNKFPYATAKAEYFKKIVFCFLEKIKNVDRECFTRVDDQKKIDKIDCCSFRKLYVKINDKKEDHPYLITVGELMKKVRNGQKPIGLVINGNFVYKSTDFVARYLGSANNEKSRIQIDVIRSETDYRLCKIEYGKKMSKHEFIIPVKYIFNQITTVYCEKKANSLQFYSGAYIKGISQKSPFCNTDDLKKTNFADFHALPTTELVFHYSFEKDDTKYEIKMKNQNDLQIKDLILLIANKCDKPLSTYEIRINNKRIDFWKPAVEFSGQDLKIKTYEYHKEIKVFDSRTKMIFRYKTNINEITVENIIKLMNNGKSENLSIYLTFHKLGLIDRPILLYDPYGILILSEDKPEKHISIWNNHGIETQLHIKSDQYIKASECIIALFGLNISNIIFKVKMPEDSNLEIDEYDLPDNFDAGSIPEYSTVLLQYNEVKKNELTFEYAKSKFEKITQKITISDPNKKIRYIKKEILDTLKIYTILPKAAAFEYLGVDLNQNNTFASYGIDVNSPITINFKKYQHRVTIRLSNKSELGDYSFYYSKDGTDTIKDIADRLKAQYQIEDEDYNIEFSSQVGAEKLNENRELENKEILYVSFEKITIKLLDPIKGKRYEFDEIIKPTKEFIENELLPLIPENEQSNEFALFIREGNNNDHYVAIDDKNSFKEIGGKQKEFFLLKKLKNIDLYYMNKKIDCDQMTISGFEQVNSFIQHYVKDIIMAPPERIKFYQNNIEVNDKFTLDQIIENKKKIEIRFTDEIVVREEKPIRKPKARIGKFRPTTTAVEQPDKPQSKGKDKKDHIVSKKKLNEEEEHKKEKNKKDEIKEEKNKEEKHKKDEIKEEKNIEDENKEEDHKEEAKEKEISNAGDGENIEISEQKNKTPEIEIEEEEEEFETVKSEIIGEEKDKAEKHEDDDDDDDDSDEDEEKEQEGEIRTYTFAIKGKEPYQIQLNKDATIKDAMEEIAKREHVMIDDVSIIFAGKKLRKKSIIAKMKFKKDEIIDVIIFEPMEMLLKTAKALKIIPADLDDDSEYEYVYEEEEEDDKLIH